MRHLTVRNKQLNDLKCGNHCTVCVGGRTSMLFSDKSWPSLLILYQLRTGSGRLKSDTELINSDANCAGWCKRLCECYRIVFAGCY